MTKNAKDFNCENCKFGRHCDESNPAPYPVWDLPEAGIRDSHVCPLPMVTPQSNEFIRLYPFYKKGHLACSGGVYDQPAKYLEAMSIIDQQVNSE